LALTQSFEAGMVPQYKSAEIVFTIIGQAFIVALVLIVARNLWRSSGSGFAVEGSARVAPVAAALLLLVLLLIPGWFPLALERMFTAAIAAGSGVPAALGPFWPQGFAIAFAAASLIIGAALAWFDQRVKAVLDWCAPAIPRRFGFLWRDSLRQL